MGTICGACGTSIVPGSRYCHGRGARMPLPITPLPERFASPISYTPPYLAERILADHSTLEGEHKQLTVLFCDIAGPTGSPRTLAPRRCMSSSTASPI
jgi:hypothetical protein